ncbi:MAG TPA: TIGR03618 family F420-dependent PPOX class oxidoreductase [Candidatus Limnocylindrales bacterium]|nr:TIGR03618 family F420-dependent PPOX class oxidoreductase [Candidatus Limnocylindrales bacterium]
MTIANPVAFPPAFLDLVECPPVAALTTLMPDGSPQTSVVWCDREGDVVRVNTMRGFAKERNMRRDPRVTLLCYEPREPLRSIEIRGLVESMTQDGALDHLDAIASKYLGRRVRYFGDCVPAALATTEVPVLCRIRPLRVVTLDARAAPGGDACR